MRKALAAAQPKAKLVLIPHMNHVLKDVDSDDRAANWRPTPIRRCRSISGPGRCDRRLREALADRQVALLVDQPPLVEIGEHEARRLLGKVGGAGQCRVLAKLLVDLVAACPRSRASAARRRRNRPGSEFRRPRCASAGKPAEIKVNQLLYSVT